MNESVSLANLLSNIFNKKIPQYQLISGAIPAILPSQSRQLDMNPFITAISTGFTAFTATNLDDIVILLLFFSQVNAVFRRQHIVTGQYLGFAALVLLSLPSFFGCMMVPRPWVGMLGLVPIAIGVSRLLNRDTEADDENTATDSPPSTIFASILSPQTYSVAAVTFANGGDNVGIYVPLFANCT